MKLAIYDTKRMVHLSCYDKLRRAGIEITTTESLQELEQMLLHEDFDGLLAHPGMAYQREFMLQLPEINKKRIKVAIFSTQPGLYATKSRDLTLLNINDVASVQTHFSETTLPQQ